MERQHVLAKPMTYTVILISASLHLADAVTHDLFAIAKFIVCVLSSMLFLSHFLTTKYTTPTSRHMDLVENSD